MGRALPYRHIMLRFPPPEEGRMPYFVGSQLRGALGYALKQTVCINPSYRCDGCFAADDCLYASWYESRGGYHSYRFDFEMGRPYYDVGFYLFSDAVDKLPYVVRAMRRMLKHHGLGRARWKTDRFRIYIDDMPVVDGEDVSLSETSPKLLDIPFVKAPDRLKVIFVTPLRIKYRNRFVRRMEDLHLPTLIASVYNRYAALRGETLHSLPFRVEGKVVDWVGVFEDLTRYSGRQGGHLKIGGLRGEVTLEGLDDESYRMLRLAEMIGAGKQTVFGLGKIRVEKR